MRRIILALILACLLVPLAFTQNPVPLINNPLIPASIAPGAPGFMLTVNGTGFVPGSVVLWNGSRRYTRVVSSSQLIASILASDVAAPATAWVTVLAPGNKTSNRLFLTISQPQASVGFSRTDYASVRDNIQIVTDDFNRDGVLDLATASWDDSMTATFLGNPDGTFQPYRSYSLSSGDHSLVSGDFNQDGFADVAIGLRASGGVDFMLGNGDGTFRLRTLNPGLASPYSLATGDFNQDGLLDLVTANEGGRSVSVFLAKPHGFLPHVDYSIGVTANLVVAGDFNQDGYLDLAVSSSDIERVMVLLGNGDGTFQAPTRFRTGTSPGNYMITADLNSDGHLDLAISTLDGPVAVLLGNGDGTFARPVSYDPGGVSISVIAADLNGDGILDLATANYQSATVSVMVGNGDGTFQSAQVFPAVGGARGFAVGDFNSDGMLDLAAGNQGASSISIFLHD